MIVNQNNYNYSIQYRKLFEDAYNILKDDSLVSNTMLNGRVRPSAPFTCLEEYFMYLDILALLHANNIEVSQNDNAEAKNAAFAQYSKFLMLPLDEDYFVINANARSITIPTTFARYGVSLSGDQRAETLLFEIDRYFDFMDLVRTSIYIQWTSPNSINGESEITLVDYDDKKIRFGWPLSSGIIDNYGTLKFSARFFMTDETDTSKIIYSLNTLPISVQVKQALRTSIGAPLYFDQDSIEFFKTAIKAGANSNAETFAEPPVIFTNLPTTKQYLDGNNTLVLDVSACPIDQGNISYAWKRSVGSTVTSLPTTGVEIDNNVYILTTDKAYVQNKHYYTSAGEGAYTLVNPATTPFDKSALFEKFSRCSITDSASQIAGTYYAEITNTVRNDSRKITTNKTLVPGPEKITYTTDLTESGADNILPNDGSALILRVSATPDDAKGKITYEWYKKTNPSTTATKLPDETSATLAITEPAWYYAVAKNTLNRASITLPSITSKITNEPAAPTIIGFTGETQQIVLEEGSKEIVINATIANADGLHSDLISDDITYVWYHKKKDVPVGIELEPATNGAHGVVSINGNKLTVQYSGDDETFICTVINTLNGKTASTNSDYYKVSNV